MAGVAIVICAIAIAAVASAQQRALPQADGFVINEDGNSIAIFGKAGVKVVSAANLGADASALSKPHLAAYDKESQRLYVGGKGGHVAVFDVSDMMSPRLLANLKPGGDGEIHRVVLAGGLVWIAHQGDSAVYAYDPADLSTYKVKLGKDKGFDTTHGLRLRPGTDELWTTNRPTSAPGTIIKIDVRTRQVIGQPLQTTGKTGDRPNNIEFTPDGRWAYVANTGTTATEVTVIDAQKFEVTQQIVQDARVGLSPHAIVYEPVSRRLFVVNQGSGTLSAINPDKNVVLGYFTIGAEPHGVTVGPDGLVYATAKRNNKVVAFEPQTLQIRKEIWDPAMLGPHQILFTTAFQLPAAEPTATLELLTPTTAPAPTSAPVPAVIAPAVPSVPSASDNRSNNLSDGQVIGMPRTGTEANTAPGWLLAAIALAVALLTIGVALGLYQAKSRQG
jgi:DNA-binding beta-propeller fold protein YncE